MAAQQGTESSRLDGVVVAAAGDIAHGAHIEFCNLGDPVVQDQQLGDIVSVTQLGNLCQACITDGFQSFAIVHIPLDLHLMIKDPEYKLPWIGIHKEDIVTIHYESTFQVQRALDYLVPYGCKRFLAINPATPIGQIEEVLDYIDGVNLLMVNPGFAGQKIVPSTLRKAEKLQKFLQEMHREDIILEVDGNITKEHGATLRSCGASIFVAGTSSSFCTDVSHFGEKIREFRKAVE